jgi:peptidoglycan/xylan/chitin deacetylase (PgdA/CDA1 family)
MKILPNTIINFHAVYNQYWMEKVIILLNKMYHIVPLSSIEDFYYNGKELKNVCHITFDDGDDTFFDTVFPIIKKHNTPVSIFVSPLAINERRNFWFQEIRGYDRNFIRKLIHDKVTVSSASSLSNSSIFKSMKLSEIWDIIKLYQKETKTNPKPCMNMNLQKILELQHSGLVHIGAHTLNHPILGNEDDETVEHEITSSVEKLRVLLNNRVSSFAYPNGKPDSDFGIREMNILKNIGIKIAFSTFNSTFSSSDNPFSIPRNGLSKGNTAFIMAKLLAGKNWELVKKVMYGARW